MDRVTESLVSDFIQKYELKSKGETFDFERFSNYSILKNMFNNDFEIEDISTGKNQGIDGISIIVNNQFITNVNEILDIVEETKILDVQFIFTQCKTSKKFEGSEIGNMFFTIKDFFSEAPSLPMTKEVELKFEIKEELFKNFQLMTKGNPTSYLYYVSLGKWQEDDSLSAIIDKNKEELNDTGYFENVQFYPCDAKYIQKLYRKTSEESSAEFSFDTSPVNLPEIPNVDESYLGLLKFAQYKNLILDENGKIKNVFYDNVRDYLGDNPINLKIDKTLKENKFSIFHLLNNGITIVADTKNASKGNQFSIRNYQIVNGCQTSHTLFNNKDLSGIDELQIPVKLIFTKNENVKSQITIATNSQTNITEEQLLAFSDFQKNLEEFYKSFTGEQKLYYERRTGQYSSDQTILKSKVVAIKNQIKAVSSMFLNSPHLASGYYGKLFKTVKDKIFKERHELLPYYTSSYFLYRFEKYIRSGEIDRKYNKARYHIMMLFKMIIANGKTFELNNKKIDIVCNKIIDSFNSIAEFKNIFNKVISTINSSRIDINNPKALYQKANTEILTNTFKRAINNGTIKQSKTKD